jgi:hypothetical protein
VIDFAVGPPRDRVWHEHEAMDSATTVTKKEAFLLKRLTRTKKLFGFLLEVRQELFNEEFQAELEKMHRDSGAGKAPCRRR